MAFSVLSIQWSYSCFIYYLPEHECVFFYFQILLVLFLFIYLACFLSVWFYIWCLDKHFDHIVILICRYIYIFDIPLVIHSSLARLLVRLFVCPFIRLRDCWRDVHAWGNWKSVITIFDGIQIVSSASANNEFCLFFHYVSRARSFFVCVFFSVVPRRDFCRQTKCLFTPLAACFSNFSTANTCSYTQTHHRDIEKKLTQFKHLTYWHT